MKLSGLGRNLTLLGPGIAVAATGVGAGDMVAAAVSGSKYGFAVVWAAAVGALFKFVLNEGLARWQLATGTTLLEGWVQRLGRWVQAYFLAYLVLWSFVVGGALISACGLALHAMVPRVSVAVGGALHSLVAALVVLLGSYAGFERLMKGFIGLMFVAIVGCALWVAPPAATLSRVVSLASIPAGSPAFILGVIGGVGGSLTLLAYGYWMRERDWRGASWRSTVRFDLSISYVLTGIFGVAIMVLAAGVLHVGGIRVRGSGGVIQMAAMLGDVLGPPGHWAFLLGFWAAVATSMLGVWQGVPYLFCDFVGLLRHLRPEEHAAMIRTDSPWYRGFLLWLAVAPLSLLWLQKPVSLIVFYSIVGALFMPFLSGTLLYMNSRTDWVGEEFRNRWHTILLLLLCLALFAYLGYIELSKIFK
ncbi:MAG: divalent metal cation transporter [Calditrichaeota bacterium]|nr:MAG: divalent metal cation transporter [Calditrichota bacterium]